MNLQPAAKVAAAAEGSFVVSLCMLNPQYFLFSYSPFPFHRVTHTFLQALLLNLAVPASFLLERPTQIPELLLVRHFVMSKSFNSCRLSFCCS